jgi:hypothetical protein
MPEVTPAVVNVSVQSLEAAEPVAHDLTDAREDDLVSLVLAGGDVMQVPLLGPLHVLQRVVIVCGDALQGVAEQRAEQRTDHGMSGQP